MIEPGEDEFNAFVEAMREHPHHVDDVACPYCVRCPYCDAAPSQPCLSNQGFYLRFVLKVHYARMEAAHGQDV